MFLESIMITKNAKPNYNASKSALESIIYKIKALNNAAALQNMHFFFF